MDLIYRPIETWPGERTAQRRPNPFESTWTVTLELLDRELRALDVAEAVLQVDSPTERDFRLDGKLRAGARLRSPAIILSFDAPGIGPLSYPCDTFDRNGYRDRGLEGWQINVRAVALGLEALRRVERYGIAGRRQQYTGWRQLGAGTPMDSGQPMTRQQAAEFIAEHAVIVISGRDTRPWGVEGHGWAVLAADRRTREKAYKMAARRLHPDVAVTGSTHLFQRLEEARRVLDEHHGR